jgi:kynurenine formamidase
LTPDFPQIALPPEMGQCWPFRIEEVSHYDERGPGWYWNNFSCGEHTGTHFDAPIHWISGRDLANNSVDTIPVGHFVAPAVVIDCSAQAAADPDHLLTVDAVLEWEKTHGRIAAGSWVLMRTDWSQRSDPEAYQNFDETPAYAGPMPRWRTSWSNSATYLASAAKPSAPMPARATTCARPTLATITCTGQGATACSASAIWTGCRLPAAC